MWVCYKNNDFTFKGTGGLGEDDGPAAAARLVLDTAEALSVSTTTGKQRGGETYNTTTNSHDNNDSVVGGPHHHHRVVSTTKITATPQQQPSHWSYSVI